MFVSSIVDGGAFVSMLNHVRYVLSRGASVSVLFTPFGNAKIPTVPGADVMQERLLPLRKVVFLPLHRRRVAEAVAEATSRFDPHVVVSYSDILNAHIGRAVKSLGKPFVVFVCGRDRFRAKPVASHFIRRGLSAADAVAFASEPLRKDFLSYHGVCDLRRVFIVHEMIDTQSLTPDPSARRSGLVLSVGRFDRQKRQALALRAFSIVAQRFPGARMLLAGDGPQLPKVKELAVKLGLGRRVDFLGRVDDLAELYRACSVFVHTALHEGFGRVIAEAMACAAPVVTSSLGGPIEILAEGGGFIVEPAPKAIAQKIIYLLENPEIAAKLGRLGRESIVRRFSPQAFAKKLDELYEYILEGER